MIRREKYGDYKDRLHQVISVRHLSDSLFILRLERNEMEFQPGQFIILGLPGGIVKREYSLYSGIDDPFLEVLIREVPDGDLSPKLKLLTNGDELIVDGPAGDFVIQEPESPGRYLFLGSGTGLSPFHCFIRSYPKIEFVLYQGIRQQSDFPLLDGFRRSDCVVCMSQEEKGDYKGYVTQYVQEHPVSGFDYAYLCGNGNMVYDSFNLLISQGFERERIFAEIFF